MKNRRDRSEIDTHNSHIHGCLPSWLFTGTLINSGGVKLVLWAQTFPLSEMMSTITKLFSNLSMSKQCFKEYFHKALLYCD